MGFGGHGTRHRDTDLRGIRLHYCHQLSAKSAFDPEVEKTVLI